MEVPIRAGVLLSELVVSHPILLYSRQNSGLGAYLSEEAMVKTTNIFLKVTQSLIVM
jgi:hypothetical protein